MSETVENVWRKCSSCKKPIAFGARYYVCSVSTCNNPRTGYVFCDVHCFERHLPGARHKDAAAVEAKAPGKGQEASGTSAGADRSPQRMMAKSSGPSAQVSAPSAGLGAAPREVLVIASRLKEYIAARSEFNTSQSVMDALSDHLRIVCDRAIDNARADGRKTVMDRDFEFLKGR